MARRRPLQPSLSRAPLPQPMYDQRLPIESVRALSRRQFVLTFRCAEIASAAQPGQFVMISVGSGIDPLLRRPMAIYEILRDAQGSPQGFSLLIEVVGRGTALLQQRQAGDVLDVIGPLGHPFPLPEPAESGVEHLLVMGGVGAAPFPLLAERLVQRGQRVRAFVGARTAELLLCVEDFRRTGVPVDIATDDGSRGHHGFVTGPLERYLERSRRESAQLYACGPLPMMKAVDRIARNTGLPLLLSFEAPMACGIGVCLSCIIKVKRDSGWTYARCCREGPIFDSRDVLWE